MCGLTNTHYDGGFTKALHKPVSKPFHTVKSLKGGRKLTPNYC
jgi:hypothetical protein